MIGSYIIGDGMTKLIININLETVEEANAILKGLGLDMNSAINIFLVQIIKHGGIPFKVKKSKMD